jgi:hypothetical protein
MRYNPDEVRYEVNEELIKEFENRLKNVKSYKGVCKPAEFKHIAQIPCGTEPFGTGIRSLLNRILDGVNHTLNRIAHPDYEYRYLIYTLLCIYKLISAFSDRVFFNDVFLNWPLKEGKGGAKEVITQILSPLYVNLGIVPPDSISLSKFKTKMGNVRNILKQLINFQKVIQNNLFDLWDQYSQTRTQTLQDFLGEVPGGRAAGANAALFRRVSEVEKILYYSKGFLSNNNADEIKPLVRNIQFLLSTLQVQNEADVYRWLKVQGYGTETDNVINDLNAYNQALLPIYDPEHNPQLVTRRANRVQLWRIIQTIMGELVSAITPLLENSQTEALKALGIAVGLDDDQGEKNAGFSIPKTFTKTSSEPIPDIRQRGLIIDINQPATTKKYLPTKPKIKKKYNKTLMEDLILKSSYLDPTLKQIRTELDKILDGIIKKYTKKYMKFSSLVDTPSLQNFKFSSMSDGSIYVEEIVDKFNGLKVSEMPDGSFYVELIPQKTSRTPTKNVRDFKNNPYKTPTLTKGLSEDKTPPPSIPDDSIAFIENLINLLPKDMIAPDGCNSIARKLNSYLSNSSEPIRQGEDIVANLNDDTIITWFHILVPDVEIGSGEEPFPAHELIFVNFYGKNIVLQGYCGFYNIYQWKQWLVSDYETNQSQFSLLKTILKRGIPSDVVMQRFGEIKIEISNEDFHQLYTTIIFPENFITSNMETFNQKIDRINLLKTTLPENLIIPNAIYIKAVGKLNTTPSRPVRTRPWGVPRQNSPPSTPQMPE